MNLRYQLVCSYYLPCTPLAPGPPPHMGVCHAPSTQVITPEGGCLNTTKNKGPKFLDVKFKSHGPNVGQTRHEEGTFHRLPSAHPG